MPEANNLNITTAGSTTFPPKFPLAEKRYKIPGRKSVYGIFMYFAAGYLILRRWDILLLIFLILLLHEAGHYLAMKYYNYSDVSIFFVPLMGALVKGSKKDISQRQAAVIILAGPLPGLVLGILLFLFDKSNSIFIGKIPVQLIAQLLIWGNLLNLLPVYPLDGGQLLNRVFLNEEGLLSNLFIIASGLVAVYIAFITKFYFLLIFPALLLARFFSTRNITKLENDMQQIGINLNVSYEELSNEDYWKIRTLLISHTPGLQNLNPEPPFSYSVREEKIALEVESVLQRTLLMDISIKEKLLLVLVWAISLALPWLISIPFLVIKYLMHFKVNII